MTPETCQIYRSIKRKSDIGFVLLSTERVLTRSMNFSILELKDLSIKSFDHIPIDYFHKTYKKVS
jgi:hypothetical protein